MAKDKQDNYSNNKVHTNRINHIQVNKGECKVIPVKTNYIRPGEPYDVIIENCKDILDDGDFLVVSETPIAISQGRLVDESEYKPSISALFLAEIWSKYIWGYLMGPIFRIKRRTIRNLRKLPPEARSHKEVILRYYGWKHALKPASEAGVDLSNAPGTFVSLLPDDPQGVSEDISRKIEILTGRKITVMIIDTDATYRFGKRIFTSLPVSIPQIRNNLGFLGYLMGRFATLEGPTPLGVSSFHSVDKLIEIAKLAEEYQKNNGKKMETVYDMENLFQGSSNNITLEMLDSITHIPAVIVR